MNNLFVYDLETHDTDRARPCSMTFHRLSKLARRNDRDLAPCGIEKCTKDTLVFVGDKCVSNALDFLLKFKGEERKLFNKIVEYNFQLHAHNGSGFDTWIILNILPCDKYIVDTTKNRKGIVSMRVFNWLYTIIKKQIPHYFFSRCGMTHLIYPLRK